MEYFFTADEHYYHYNIIQYENRPFSSSDEMDEVLVKRHNEIVGKRDIVIHAGDFTLKSKEMAKKIIQRLKGQHIFLKGSHDHWLPKSASTRWEKRIDDIYIVVDHYPMRSWSRSHYGSWQLHGHSHGHMPPYENQKDIGVDTNNYYPYSFEELKALFPKNDTAR